MCTHHTIRRKIINLVENIIIIFVFECVFLFYGPSLYQFSDNIIKILISL